MRNSRLFLRSYLAFLLPVAFISGCGGGSTSSPITLPSPTPAGTFVPGATPTATAISEARVACVGDSITYGHGVEDRGQNAYPVVLGRWLGKGNKVVNYGVGRTTALDIDDYSYQKQTAFANALAFKPTILVVALGTNDSTYPFTTEERKTQFSSSYRGLIDAFKKANPSVKVYLCLPVPAYPIGRKQNVILSNILLPLIQEVAHDSGATLIDLNTALSNHEELFPDRVHPDATGAKLIAATVYRSLTGNTAPSP